MAAMKNVGQKDAPGFLARVTQDTGLAKAIDDALNDPVNGLQKAAEVLHKEGYHFGMHELGALMPHPALTKFLAHPKWAVAAAVQSAIKAPRPTAIGSGGGRVATLIAGDPGSAGVAKQRGKKVPWRASW
jgi:hypothetical protein